MILTKGATVVTLQAPAQYPAGYDYSIVQASDKSASGVTHVESFMVRTNVSSYVFEDMSTVDYTALLNFFLEEAEGMLNEFELTDDLNRTTTVRFAEANIHFDMNYYGLWAGSFRVEEVIG